MKKPIQLIATVSLLCTLSFADGENHRFPMDLPDLGLTSQQHKAVETAMKEYRQAYRIHHRSREKTQQELNALFLQPTFNETVFRTKMMDIQNGSIEIRTRLFARLHGILTPEQKRRFLRHVEEWEVE